MDSCWLRLEAGGRWGMHELIRQYCEAKLRGEHEAETGEGEEQVKARHVAYFRYFVVEKHVALQQRPEALPEIEPELGNLMAAWEGFADPSDLARMRRVTAGFGLMADRLLWWPVLLPLVERSIRQARADLANGGQDATSRRRLELALAWFLFLTTEGKQAIGRYGDSHRVLDEAEALLGDGAPDDPDWAETHYMIVRNRAWVHYLLGNWTAAEQGWSDALAQIRTARFPVWVFPPYSSLPPQSEILLGLAWNALESGRYDQGLLWAREAVDMAVEFNSLQYEAFMKSVLVAALSAVGEYREAERVAKQALHLAHSVHAPHLVLQILAPFVDLYRDLGRPDLTRIWARRYALLCEDTGYIESGLPWVLTNLSWAELQLGRAYEARRHALRSMETIERSGGAEHSGYGDAAVTLGRVALAEGKLEETATWARRALSSPARRTGATAGALQLLADIRRVRGDPEAAAEILAADRTQVAPRPCDALGDRSVAARTGIGAVPRGLRGRRGARRKPRAGGTGRRTANEWRSNPLIDDEARGRHGQVH